jgi:hypothetical protein
MTQDNTPLIFVDFDNEGDRMPEEYPYTRVYLTPPGTDRELSWGRYNLRVGGELHLYSDETGGSIPRDDVVVTGIAAYDEKHRRWFGLYDETARRPRSEIANEPEHWANQIDWQKVYASELTRGREFGNAIRSARTN